MLRSYRLVSPLIVSDSENTVLLPYLTAIYLFYMCVWCLCCCCFCSWLPCDMRQFFVMSASIDFVMTLMATCQIASLSPHPLSVFSVGAMVTRCAVDVLPFTGCTPASVSPRLCPAWHRPRARNRLWGHACHTDSGHGNVPPPPPPLQTPERSHRRWLRGGGPDRLSGGAPRRLHADERLREPDL